jgi:hypothetical protein
MSVQKRTSWNNSGGRKQDEVHIWEIHCFNLNQANLDLTSQSFKEGASFIE